MFNKLKAKLNNIKFYEEKKRFLLFSVMLLLALFLAYYLFKGAYASYKSSAKLVTNIDKALYLIDTDKMSFNIDPEQIVPSLEPYTYKFSVSNFNSSRQGEVSLLYTVKVITTTNLPISIQLYRNENYDDSQATPLLTGARTVQDEDGSWYNIYDTNIYKYVYGMILGDGYLKFDNRINIERIWWTMLFKVLQNLIKNKRYSKEDIQDRIDVFMAYNRITEEQYAELMNLIDEVYGTENAENSAKTEK